MFLLNPNHILMQNHQYLINVYNFLNFMQILNFIHFKNRDSDINNGINKTHFLIVTRCKFPVSFFSYKIIGFNSDRFCLTWKLGPKII